MEQKTVDEMLAWQSGVRLEAVAERLRARGFEAEVCATREAARERVIALAADAASVGFGGSLSVACLNLTRELREAGKEILNHGFPNLSPEEKLEIMRRQQVCDLFLSSANALTDEGVIVNVDGNGNRVAATLFGPRRVVYVIGRNKVVTGGVHAALARVAAVAGPVNAHRLGKRTPCAATGKCADCAGACPESICRIATIVRQRPSCTPTTVLLVNEDLGL